MTRRLAALERKTYTGALRRLFRAAAALALSLPIAARADGAPVPARPERYVTDASGVLEATLNDALNEKLAAFERLTSNQVLVWIAPHVPEGTTLEALGADAIRAWGVGQKGRDNGAVLFVITGERRTRIAVGYGLEGAIPDATAKRILAEVMRPHLSRGDFGAGIVAGVDAILAAAAADGLTGTGRTVAEGASGPGALGFAGWALLLAAAAALVVAFRRRSTGLLVLLAVPGFAGLAVLVQGLAPRALVTQLFLGSVLGFLSLALALVRFLPGSRPTGSWSGSWSGSGGGSSSFDSSSSFSSSDSSSSSSSSFDGGGGDSGGGGASDQY
jgi:uncharacterized protein